MNGATLAGIVVALLGGGGTAALIQIFLLPRTMARTRADTTQVLVGTATDTVALVKGQLDRANGEITELRTKLSEARGRMQEQEEQITRQRARITEQESHIETLTAETDALRNRVRQLEERVNAAAAAMDNLNNGEGGPAGGDVPGGGNS